MKLVELYQKQKLKLHKKINHDGEVNKARHMPQDCSFIATKPANSYVYIFDYTKQPTTPSSDGVCSPLLKLKGHSKEGYGLCWSNKIKGRLASGSDDGVVCVWDIDASSNSSKNNEVSPIATFTGHDSIVEDVSFHRVHDSMLGSVSDDRYYRIWDIRSKDKPVQKVKAHSAEINGIDFSPASDFLFVTASSDKTIKLWDIRNPDKELHVFTAHTDEVFSICWSPFHETIFASGSSDRRVMLWDLSKIGNEQNADDAEDGPPELLFIHGGHTSKVTDLSWNPNKGEEWVIMSTADDNIVQIWQMAENIYLDPEDPDEFEN